MISHLPLMKTFSNLFPPLLVFASLLLQYVLSLETEITTSSRSQVASPFSVSGEQSQVLRSPQTIQLELHPHCLSQKDLIRTPSQSGTPLDQHPYSSHSSHLSLLSLPCGVNNKNINVDRGVSCFVLQNDHLVRRGEGACTEEDCQAQSDACHQRSILACQQARRRGSCRERFARRCRMDYLDCITHCLFVSGDPDGNSYPSMLL